MRIHPLMKGITMRTVIMFGKTFVLAFVVLDIIQTIYRHYKRT